MADTVKIGGMQEALLKKPARDLSDQEALDVFIFLVEQGEIELGTSARVADDGTISSLRRGMQMDIRPVLAGVDFYHVGKGTKTNGSTGKAKDRNLQPTAAFAVLLCRLAKRLSDQWDVTQIVWGGIGSGGGCHTSGHCIDFYGATTAGGRDFDVRRDWYRRPVFKKDGTLHPTSPTSDDKWGNDTKTYFRLWQSNLPEDEITWRFFADVYTFVTEQCTIGPLDIGAGEFRTGGDIKEGFCLHPDYPRAEPRARRDHNDHMHFQLGTKAYE